MKVPNEVVTAGRNSIFETGSKMMINGQYLDAIQLFDEAIGIIPYHARAWYAKGECLLYLKQYEKSIICFDNALRFDPGYQEAGFRENPGFPKELENLKRLVVHLNESVKIEPNNAELLYNRGVMMRVLGKINEALDSFEQVIKIKPDSFDAWSYKGGLLGIAGWHERDPLLPRVVVPQQLNDAIKAYDQALKIKRDQVALLNSGVVMVRAGQRNHALKSFDEAIRMSPEYGDAWVQKGVLLVKMKKREEADKCFERALQINPEYFMYYGTYIEEYRPSPLTWD